jgi:hypothetical protein
VFGHGRACIFAPPSQGRIQFRDQFRGPSRVAASRERSDSFPEASDRFCCGRDNQPMAARRTMENLRRAAGWSFATDSRRMLRLHRPQPLSRLRSAGRFVPHASASPRGPLPSLIAITAHAGSLPRTCIGSALDSSWKRANIADNRCAESAATPHHYGPQHRAKARLRHEAFKFLSAQRVWSKNYLAPCKRYDFAVKMAKARETRTFPECDSSAVFT